jgi:hypothetical protein
MVFKAKARPSFCASPCEQPHALEGLTEQTETGRDPAEQMPSMGFFDQGKKIVAGARSSNVWARRSLSGFAAEQEMSRL